MPSWPETFALAYLIMPALEFVGDAGAKLHRTCAEMTAKRMAAPTQTLPLIAIAPVSVALLFHRNNFT